MAWHFELLKIVIPAVLGFLFGRLQTGYTDKVSRTKDCSGQVISDSLIDFFDVDSRSKALGDMLPSFECSLMLL